jgi:dethiobiotin synthetase
MGALFITATGTDIGKTHLACALIRYLRGRGQDVEALKPVATGFDPMQPDKSDTGLLLAALDRPATMENIASVTPWHFAAPLAPERAARREGRLLDFDQLVAFTRAAVRDHRGTLLIEGIGGVMVPLTPARTVLDWMAAIRIPVILVAGSYLGSISHTLTCLEVMRQRDLALAAVVINESDHSTVTLEDTVESIALFAKGLPILSLKRAGASDEVMDRIYVLVV